MLKPAIRHPKGKLPCYSAVAFLLATPDTLRARMSVGEDEVALEAVRAEVRRYLKARDAEAP